MFLFFRTALLDFVVNQYIVEVTISNVLVELLDVNIYLRDTFWLQVHAH